MQPNILPMETLPDADSGAENSNPQGPLLSRLAAAVSAAGAQRPLQALTTLHHVVTGLGGASTGFSGGSGGAGGGALKISATGTITIASGATVQANGGDGGGSQNVGASGGGGAGSGGAIWLAAPTIDNQGSVSAGGGVNNYANGAGPNDGVGGDGRIRTDTAGAVTPTGSFTPSIGHVGTY